MKATLGDYPKIFNIESDPREEALQAGRQFVATRPMPLAKQTLTQPQIQ